MSDEIIEHAKCLRDAAVALLEVSAAVLAAQCQPGDILASRHLILAEAHAVQNAVHQMITVVERQVVQ